MRLTEIIPVKATQGQLETYIRKFLSDPWTLFHVEGQLVDVDGTVYDAGTTNAVVQRDGNILFLHKTMSHRSVEIKEARLIVSDFLRLLPPEYRIIPADPHDPDRFPEERVRVEKYFQLFDHTLEHNLIVLSGDTINFTHRAVINDLRVPASVG